MKILKLRTFFKEHPLILCFVAKPKETISYAAEVIVDSIKSIFKL